MYIYKTILVGLPDLRRNERCHLSNFFKKSSSQLILIFRRCFRFSFFLCRLARLRLLLLLLLLSFLLLFLSRFPSAPPFRIRGDILRILRSLFFLFGIFFATPKTYATILSGTRTLPLLLSSLISSTRNLRPINLKPWNRIIAA